jgi:hypothetical protein
MEFSIESLKSAGAFVGAPVSREIEWNSDGKTHSATVHIRLSSYDRALKEFDIQREGGDVLVGRIVGGIVDPSGVPVFSAEHIQGDPVTGEGKMCASLFFALLTAINDANGYQVEEVKN